jgi:hypothetical protein
MKKWLMNFLGFTELLKKQQRTNEILELIHKECKRNSDLVEAYNRQYHIR